MTGFGSLDRMEALIPGINAKVKFLKYTATETVPAGNCEEVKFYPPPGKRYQLLGFRLNVNAVPGATSGEHDFYIYRENTWYEIGVYNYGISYNSSNIFGVMKSDKTVIYVTKIFGDEENAIVCRYNNRTDADQTNKRNYRLVVLEY